MDTLENLADRVRHLEMELKRMAQPPRTYSYPIFVDRSDRSLVKLEARLQFIPLTTPLISTAFNGDSFSDTAKTKIDLSAAFSAPAGISAIYAFIIMRDSGSAGEWAYLILSPTDIADNGQKFGMQVANDTWQTYSAIIPCDENGDIYYQIYATGVTTFDIYLEIFGYWL